MAIKRTSALQLCNIVLLTLVATQAVTGCIDGEVRQAQGHDSRQYIQYCSSNEWRSMCAGVWLDTEAQVVCRQLGFSDEGMKYDGYCGGVATQNYFRITTICQGDEKRIQDCGSIVELSMCMHCINGWLSCLPVCSTGEIRLVNGSTNREGRVEVCVDGRWGTVCNKSHEGIAGAICSQLGLPIEGVIATSAFGPGITQINNCTVQTGGSLSCSLITDGSCDHSMDLGVVCRTNDQLCTELPDQCSSPDPPTTTSGRGSDITSTTIIAALGAVLSILLVLLLTTVAVVIYKKKRQTNEHRDVTNQTRDKASADQLSMADNPAYKTVSQAGERTSADQRYMVVNPVYKAVRHDQQDESGYEIVGL